MEQTQAETWPAADRETYGTQTTEDGTDRGARANLQVRALQEAIKTMKFFLEALFYIAVGSIIYKMSVDILRQTIREELNRRDKH